ncbi:hypothetical protein ACJMK2_036644 [Sinanodonta woodiana]|uniref:BTB domain-containing protein n=1 Tax=Sinanodonta woodiana TaxID=1069815 RepID=A0ABD3WHV7_SINWO
MAETYLIHRLNQMRMEGQLCDVHLVADDASTFPVHGLLLVAADEYFYRLVVNANNGPIVIKAGVSRPELESVVHFVYGVQSSGKQLEMGLQKMQMATLLNKFANICSSKNEVGDTDMNGHVNNSNEVKPVININDNKDNIYFKTSDYSVHNTCPSDINLHSPVKVKIEMKSVVEPNPLDIGVSSSEHGETVSLKHILPENVKQECLLEKEANNMESNHCSFSDEIPMPSLVKCETPRCIPSSSEERPMPTLEKIKCKSARTPPGSFFPVIVKSEPISPPDSPVPKVLHPNNSGIILENSGFACPETAYHVNQEATCSADHVLPHCFKERGQSQNDFSSCNRKLGAEDTRLTVFTQSLPVIKTGEKDCFGEMSDKYTLLENDMLILKDAQMLSIASTSETQIMQMNTSSIHSGKVVLPRASKLTDSNTLGTCTQFLDQSQNSALGLPIIQGIPLYSPIGQSHPAEGIIIQNPPGAMVTLVPSAVSNLHVNFCATKFQQDMETYISSDKKQKCDPKFHDMKQTTHSSPAKNMNNSDISNCVVYPGKVIHNMGSNRGRKKFSKIPMIMMRRNSVSFRKRSYDSMKITDVISLANDENTVEVESEKNTSSGGLMLTEDFNSSLNTAAVIDGQLIQSLSKTQNDHATPSCIGPPPEKPKTKCSRQTKPKFFHGYSSSFIPIGKESFSFEMVQNYKAGIYSTTYLHFALGFSFWDFIL